MRFERLHLLRYGALTDREIVFRPDARLHLVYGPNEAGKSSALSAISDLLFGFPHAKAFHFLHDAAALRVGATLAAGDGSRLSFRRRRGNQATLIADDDDERALHEDALAPYLGSLSREVFERAFGLNSERLRLGADEMLKSEGELGNLLFAAASGLVGLSALKKSLDAEANGIFAPRASKERLFYQILARHDEARREERANELKASDWKALNQAIADLEEAQDALNDKRAGTRRNLALLQRLKQIRPIVAEIDREEAKLATYSDIAGLPVGLGQKLAAVLADVKAEERSVALAQAEAAKRRDLLARIDVDETVLAAAEEINALFAQSGDYAGKQKDLPRIVAERDDYAGQIEAVARRLGLAPTDLKRLQPNDIVLAQFRTLIAEGRRLDEVVASTERLLAAERMELAALEERQPSGFLTDPKPWRDRLAALVPDLKTLERRDELEANQRREQRRIKEAAASLSPPIADLDALATAPLPSAETVRRQRDRLADLTRELKATRVQMEESAARLEQLDAAIAETVGNRPVPSLAAIRDVRQERDSVFAVLRAALLGEVPAPSAEEARVGVTGFETLSRKADGLADEGISDAQRVSDHAAQLRQRAELMKVADGLATHAAEIEMDLEAAGRDYRAPFERLGLAPTEPDAMIGWLSSVSDLLKARQTMLDQADEVAVLEALDRRVRPTLTQVSDGIGLEKDATLPMVALVRLITQRLEEIGESWSEGRALAAGREAGEKRLRKLLAERAKVASDLESWRSRFDAAVGPLGLEAGIATEEATAALQLWEGLPELQHQHDNRDRRVTGMRRDMAAFETAAKRLVEELAPDLDGLPPDHAAKVLSERVQQVRTAGAQRQTARTGLSEAEADLARCRQALEAAIAARDEALAGCPEDAEADVLAARLGERDAVRDELAKCRRRFGEVADDVDETAVRLELAEFDAARADVDIDSLSREEAALDSEMNALFARLSEKRRERDGLDAAEGAERAAFERNAAETEIVAAARQWTVLKLSSALLSAALEKHRESQDDPLMQRAGRLFSILTGGSFASLARRFDENDRPALVGLRRSGEAISISGMSDGTRDQLYLALRLAFLEDYAGRNEAAPFIGDDIFQTFDDERTAAGLLALAEASTNFQPVLFAHHRSVADVARDALGSDLDLIEI